MLLRDKDRQRLIRLLEEHITVPAEVWVYGSRVDGTAHEGSDIDLVIRTADLAPLPIGMLYAFREAHRDSNIPILMDAFDWATLPTSFQKNIQERHEVFWRKI